MSVKQGWSFVVSLAVVLSWSSPALASGCDDSLNVCLQWAWEETGDLEREAREAQCYAAYNNCMAQSAVCSDGVCSGQESCSTCPQDCGTGNASYPLQPAQYCSSSVDYTYINYLASYRTGDWCNYPVYQRVTVTCSVYSRTQIYTCGNPPYVQESYSHMTSSSGDVYVDDYREYRPSGYCNP
jgi:hypothetical protein